MPQYAYTWISLLILLDKQVTSYNYILPSFINNRKLLAIIFSPIISPTFPLFSGLFFVLVLDT